MKRVARAGFMVLGIPNLVSVGIAVLLVAVMARLLPEAKKPVLLQAAEVVIGLVSVFASRVISKIVPIEAAFCILGISVIWFLVHFMQLNRLTTFLRVAAGVILGCLCFWM